MNTKQAYINGFVKRAAEYDFDKQKSIMLLKKAIDIDSLHGHLQYGRLAALGGVISGAAIDHIAKKGITANTPQERINQKELKNWAKKYLKSDNIIVFPKKGLDNASYSSVDYAGRKYHVIQYDPRIHKSVGAHEIGHGMGNIPRVPYSNYIGPLLANFGAYRAALTAGESGLLPLAAGLGAQLPTLADEWLASYRAKKILKENNVPEQGLDRAWLSYASPLIGTALAAGAGYLARDLRTQII